LRGVAFQFRRVSTQYAALPWRRVDGELQILLVTTLNTRRWIVPKGWPIPGLSPSGCAAHEAAEEAGVSGDVDSKPLGSFHYEKRLKSGTQQTCNIEVFAMRVLRQRRSWPEKGARKLDWCTVDEALARVGEPGLRRLIARFAKVAGADKRTLEAVPSR
jgi:8-oxo-dGTP pyrophosphatase MutT (NUDIX family)